MKLLFWLVKNKINKRGEIPIYCRITIDGKRAELKTDILVKESDFDNQKKRIKGKDDLAQNKNRKLEQIAYKLNSIYINEVLNNRKPTAGEVKELFSSRRVNINTLMELLNAFALEKLKA